MTCGFTTDFADFLAKSNIALMKIIQAMASKDPTSSVQLMEARPTTRKNQQKSLLSWFMETVMLPSEEAHLMATWIGKPDTEL